MTRILCNLLLTSILFIVGVGGIYFILEHPKIVVGFLLVVILVALYNLADEMLEHFYD